MTLSFYRLSLRDTPAPKQVPLLWKTYLTLVLGSVLVSFQSFFYLGEISLSLSCFSCIEARHIYFACGRKRTLPSGFLRHPVIETNSSRKRGFVWVWTFTVYISTMIHCMVLDCTYNSRKNTRISYHCILVGKQHRDKLGALVKIRLFARNILRLTTSRKTRLASCLAFEVKGLGWIIFLQWFPGEVLESPDMWSK